MNKLGGIYAIVNTSNNKKYIGSAIEFNNRWRIHKHHLKRGNHHSPHLQAAWNKYGEESFRFTIIEIVEDSRKLIDREQYYLDVVNPEYNASKVAGSMLGYRFSEEQRQRCSDAHKGRHPTKETREKLSIIASNRPRKKYSQELKDKLSNAHKGFIPNQNQIRGLESGRLGPYSAERRRNISESQKGYQPTPETIEKLKLAWVRRKERALLNGRSTD